MNIKEMHIWFRQYAQQMGMQNVRAILPEQIDLLINTSIQDTINQIIKENIGITNDRVITDNSKIGQINALQSLYNVAIIDMSPSEKIDEETKAFVFNAKDRLSGRMTTKFDKLSDTNIFPDYLFLVDASINYRKTKDGLGYTGINDIKKYYTYNLLAPTGSDVKYVNLRHEPFIFGDIIGAAHLYSPKENDDVAQSTNVILDLYNGEPVLKTTDNRYIAIDPGSSDVPSFISTPCYRITTNFKDGDPDINNGVLRNPVVQIDNGNASEYKQPQFLEDGIETNLFPIRVIDDAYLADTLNDFILKNRLRSPIMVIYNNGNEKVYDIYIDTFHKDNINGRYTLQNGLIPYQFRLAYIAKPAKVKYAEDIDGENVDCNLPEYMHVDILKHAVDLYRISISGALQAAQQQQQTAQQENTRNNYRNENGN